MASNNSTIIALLFGKAGELKLTVASWFCPCGAENDISEASCLFCGSSSKLAVSAKQAETARRRRHRQSPKLRPYIVFVSLLIVGFALAYYFYGVIGPLRLESDPVKRVEIARRLGNAKDIGGIRHLVRAMGEDTDAHVRAAAACALGQIKDQRALRPLILKANQIAEEKDVTICALRSLRQMPNREAVPPLIRLMGETSGPVRVEVIQTIQAERDPAALEPLVDVVRMSQGGDELEAAERAVASIGETALPRVRDLYRNGYSEKAINTLRFMGQPGVADLLEIFRTAPAKVRPRAVRGLLLAGDPVGVATMRNEMRTNIKLVAEAYKDLIELGDGSFVDLLIRALNTYGDSSMAVDFLNCGQLQLDDAARRWAKSHGYEIMSRFGGSGTPRWGRR